MDGLFLKLEGSSPTGTFKDRIMSQLISERGTAATGAVVASSGNAAVAASAACRSAGIPLLVVVPQSTPPDKLAPISARRIPIVEYGDDPSAAYRLARHLSGAFGLLELASTFYLPGSEYACRAIGHEIAVQLPQAPKAVAAAVSIGPALVGTGNGLLEASGFLPALLAGQVKACSPIARAFASGSQEVEPWTDSVTTAAGSIADRLTGYAQEANLMLRLARESSGFVHAYDDETLMSGREKLLTVDGVDAELASVAGLCAALDWSGDKPVVAVITGSGWRETLSGGLAHRVSVEDYASQIGEPGVAREVRQWLGGDS